MLTKIVPHEAPRSRFGSTVDNENELLGSQLAPNRQLAFPAYARTFSDQRAFCFRCVFSNDQRQLHRMSATDAVLTRLFEFVACPPHVA